ncbi:hypothetical protein [Pseudonocardia hierapolitana]|uniref:hypothetical protein n=1 Tax=Pseudonocardia hierapolitana TaxID=1128676 RepID=UPI001BAF6A23|nr:hypothetical protein [Pseudonocardia hierapolitana]
MPPAPGAVAARLAIDADPAVRVLARRDLLGEPAPDGDVLLSPIVRGLLAGLEDTRVPARPYAKWTGAHWRLVSLVELGIPAGYEPAVRAAETVLDCWAAPDRLAGVLVVDGLRRMHASQEGNAVAVACRLGMAADERVARLVEHLVGGQWPDGGWNCDRRPAAHRSSVHETLPALWGLSEYATATGDARSRRAATAAAEVLLARHVVFAAGTDRPLHRSVVDLHYPPYWHYDVLQALVVLDRAGCRDDPRTDRARRVVAGKQREDGGWRAVRPWWRRPGSAGLVEAVDWGDVAHQMVTLNALRVTAPAAGRTPVRSRPSPAPPAGRPAR